MSRRTRKPHPKQVATRKANTWNEKASRKACPLARANVYIQRVNKKACQHEPYTKQTLQVNNNHVNPSWRVHVRQLDTNSWANIVLHILNRQPIPQLNNISFSRRLARSNQRSGKKVPKTSQYENHQTMQTNNGCTARTTCYTNTYTPNHFLTRNCLIWVPAVARRVAEAPELQGIGLPQIQRRRRRQPSLDLDLMHVLTIQCG